RAVGCGPEGIQDAHRGGVRTCRESSGVGFRLLPIGLIPACPGSRWVRFVFRGGRSGSAVALAWPVQSTIGSVRFGALACSFSGSRVVKEPPGGPGTERRRAGPKDDRECGPGLSGNLVDWGRHEPKDRAGSGMAGGAHAPGLRLADGRLAWGRA